MTTLEKLNKQIRFENGNLSSISIAGKTDLWFADVEKETEKAVQIQWLGKLHWLPKSAFYIVNDDKNPNLIVWNFRNWALEKIMSKY